MYRNRTLSFLVGTLLLTACSSGDPAAVEVSILADGQRFSPARIEVLAGKPVTLNFYNLGNEEHQIAIQDIPLIVQDKVDPLAVHAMEGMNSPMARGVSPQVHAVAPVGKQAQLTFVPAKAGQYVFRCILPGHTEDGILVVQ